jgi:hypothetical protein
MQAKASLAFYRMPSGALVSCEGAREARGCLQRLLLQMPCLNLARTVARPGSKASPHIAADSNTPLELLLPSSMPLQLVNPFPLQSHFADES